MFNSDLSGQSPLGQDKSQLRNIYDKLTLDTSQSPVSAEDSPSPAKSDSSLGELRFDNWVAITELLALAEEHEARKEKMISKAIELNVPVTEVQKRKEFQVQSGESPGEEKQAPKKMVDLTERILRVRGFAE